MDCQHCGHKNNDQARFCQNCGQHMTAQNQQIDRLNSVNHSVEANKWNEETAKTENQDMLAFVGPRYNYYQEKWALSEDPATAANWNWSAFFLGIFWLGYRKMYRPILYLLATYIVLDVIDLLANFHPLTSLIVEVAPYVAFALIGMYGNALYYRHANKQINKLKRYDYAHEQMSKKGGTSKLGVIKALGLLLSYAIIYFIFYLTLYTGTISFGTSEGQFGITDIKEQFEMTETIYYEADFGKTANTTYVDVILFYQEVNQETIYAQFEEEISPDWTGFYNYLYDPTYDYLEPGHYIVRIYRDDQLLSEGEFSIKGITY